MLNFGETIKSKREAKGLTQKQLAEKLFVSDKAISRWENNYSYPDITLLLEIAKVLEFDYQELLEGQSYVQKKMNKKRKQKNLLIILSLVLVAVCLMFVFYMNKRNSNLGKDVHGVDFISSCKWKDMYGSDGIGNAFLEKTYTDYQQNKILEYLNVDEWEEILELPSTATCKYFINFDNDLKIESYKIYADNNQAYAVLDYTINNHKSRWFSKITQYETIYQCNSDLSNLLDFIYKLTAYNFEYNHEMINNTNFRRLTEDEILNMDEALYSYSPAFEVLGGKLLLSKNGPFYLYFSSQSQNISEISFVDGIVYLTGQPRIYSNPYVCIYEITDPDNIHEIHYNGERIFGYGVDYRHNETKEY